MKAAKSEGGSSTGRMRNSDFGHKCWVQILNHFSGVNYLMEVAVKKHGRFHIGLTKTRMKRDSEVIELALKWLKKTTPSTTIETSLCPSQQDSRLASTVDDAINAERATEVEREMQIKLDGKSVTSTMEVKFKVNALSSLRKNSNVYGKKIHLNSLKLFNRLLILAQR